MLARNAPKATPGRLNRFWRRSTTSSRKALEPRICALPALCSTHCRRNIIMLTGGHQPRRWREQKMVMIDPDDRGEEMADRVAFAMGRMNSRASTPADRG